MYPEYETMRVTTTFWNDFSIADAFGPKAVLDTYNRAFKEWRSDYKYLTELVMVLNHKAWHHYSKGNTGLSELYSDLYIDTNDWAYDNLEGEALDFYFHVTD